MKRTTILIAAPALLLMSGTAWADDTAECLKKSQPLIEAFNTCAVPKVEARSKGNEPIADVIQSVIKDCSGPVEEARKLLHVPPCSQDDAQTETVISGWMDQAREDMTSHIEELRK